MKQATFRVIDPKSAKLINEYKLEYSDGKDLNSIYQEARQVWGEYQVEVETEEFNMSSSHTYQEQLLLEVSLDNFLKEINSQM